MKNCKGHNRKQLCMEKFALLHGVPSDPNVMPPAGSPPVEDNPRYMCLTFFVSMGKLFL